MHAMFAPGLCDGFKFDIGGLCSELLIVFLNGLHLDQIQKQVLFFAKSYQPLVVKVAYRPVYYL